MDSIVLLKWALFGEVYISVRLVASIFCHAVYLTWSRRRYKEQLYRAKKIMVAALESRSLAEADYSYVASLPKNARSRLLIDLIFNLDGSQREWLVGLAKRTGLIGDGEANCRSRWWWRHLRGARLLTALGGGETVVPQLFDDPSPVVRAQAAEWAIGHPDTKIVRRLIQMLADGSGLCKFAVQDSLLQMGSSVTEPLAEYLSDPSSQQVGAAMEVAARLTAPQFLNPAISRCGDQAPETRALAADMLAALGST